MKRFFILFFTGTVVLTLSACGGGKKNIAMKLHSDPLGAYALLQVREEGNQNTDWIFLGPTPVITNKEINLKGASSVSVKVIRPGFYEQVKTWSVRDFLKEYKQNKAIIWVPNMVKQ